MHTPIPWIILGNGDIVHPTGKYLAALEKMVADAIVPWPEGAGAWPADRQEEFAAVHFASVLTEAKAAIAKAKGEAT